MSMSRSCAAIAAIMLTVPALAAEIKITITPKSMKKWTVSEVTNGSVVTASPVYVGTYSGLYSIGLSSSLAPNDGYWFADFSFALPANAINPKLIITELGVDDRAVVALNGNIVASDEPYTTGSGYMTLTDGGVNQPWTFLTQAGIPTKILVKTGFVAGQNDLRMIVNNTGNGGQGSPCPSSCGGGTFVGIAAKVIYAVTP